MYPCDYLDSCPYEASSISDCRNCESVDSYSIVACIDHEYVWSREEQRLICKHCGAEYNEHWY